VAYTSIGDIVYPADSVGVKITTCIRRESDSVGDQTYFFQHCGIISALATHISSVVTSLKEETQDINRAGTGEASSWWTDDTLIATGECVRDSDEIPAVVVWTADGMRSRSVLTGHHRRSISQLGFSKSGELLVSCGTDERRLVAVHRWRDRQLVYTGVGVGGLALDCDFSGSDDRFACCGALWYRRRGDCKFRRERGILEKALGR